MCCADNWCSAVDLYNGGTMACWHVGMLTCWHVPIQWTHKPVSVSVFSIQPSRLSLSTDTDCTALVCSRGENLALLSRIRGNFVTFVQFVGNNQPLPLCLAPWLGAACRHGPGHSALWETGKCKKRILINSEPLRRTFIADKPSVSAAAGR